LIVAHQATVTDLKAQIHDAYCLRAMKNGWTAESKDRLWAWYQKSSQWEGGYSFQGYLDLMIRELVRLLSASEKERYLARAHEFPFPTRLLVRGLNLETSPGAINALASLYVKLGAGPRSGAAADLRALVIEKLGNGPNPAAQGALRELYQQNPAERDPIARALAAHPAEDSLPILVSALDSRDSNTTSLILRALGRLKSVPKGPEALGGLIRLARRSGPSMAGTLNRLASKWTGAAAPEGSSNEFERTLAAWEAVYNRMFPNGPSLAKRESPGENSYSLPQLVENVLQSQVMKSASSERGRQLIERAKCLDCHKFGAVGQGVGPDLTTVRSRFRPIEILESIVEPSKVISDQYKAATIATLDGKIFNGMPVGSDGAALVLLLSDGTKVTIPKSEIDGRKESTVSVMPEGLINSMSYQEIADLLALFDSAPKVEPGGEANGKSK
jgi:putative heme-binding domain-containing protein